MSQMTQDTAGLTTGLTADAAPPKPVERRKWKIALRELRRAPWTAKVGVAIVSVYSFVALFAPVLAPYGEAQVVGAVFEPIGGEYAWKLVNGSD